MDTVGERGVSPSGPSRKTLCPAVPSLPWVPWGAVPHLPRYYAPRRLPPARLGSLHSTFASRYRACFMACVVAPSGSWPGRSPQVTPGPWVARSPTPGMRLGDRWFSHVPAFPLCRHAPLSAPGGIRRTRLYRPQDCCLPVLANRRLWPRSRCGYPADHDSTYFGAQ